MKSIESFIVSILGRSILLLRSGLGNRAPREIFPKDGRYLNEFGLTIDIRDRSLCHKYLNINDGDRVLDVGGGHNPLKRANVVVDLDVHATSHRNHNPLRLYEHQQFMQASVENLPFKSKEFDYVFCSQTLEHVSNPQAACAELQRVAKRGLIDAPRSCLDLAFSHTDHIWLIDRIDGILYFRPKPIKTTSSVIFDNWASIGWRFDQSVQERVDFLYRNVSNNLFEWEDSFEFKVCESW